MARWSARSTATFDDCMRLIQEIADDPSIYLANSINPFRIEGQKTVAFELMEQCEWRVPDHVVVPGGNMGNSSALGKGFEEMRQLGLIERLPKLSVIQAEGAAPLARLFASLQGEPKSDRTSIPEELTPVENPQTLATAIKIGSPVSWEKALRSVIRSHGQVITVSEQEIADAKAMIGRDGIGCEPASATTVAGIRKLVAARFYSPRRIGCGCSYRASLERSRLCEPLSPWHFASRSRREGSQNRRAPD